MVEGNYPHPSNAQLVSRCFRIDRITYEINNRLLFYFTHFSIFKLLHIKKCNYAEIVISTLNINKAVDEKLRLVYLDASFNWRKLIAMPLFIHKTICCSILYFLVKFVVALLRYHVYVALYRFLVRD